MFALRTAFIVLATIIVASCSAQRQAVDYRPTRIPVSGPRATGPTLGGFRLGEHFLDATRRCTTRGYRTTWDPTANASTCSNVVMPVGHPVESVFLRRCGNELCQITVRIPVEGETQLQHALTELREAWSAADKYGVPDEVGDETDPVCQAELVSGRYGCLLRGEGRFVRTWHVESIRGAQAQLTAFGAAGTQRATIRATLATAEGIAQSRVRDL